MIPQRLVDFIDCLNDRDAAKKLHNKIRDLQKKYPENVPYITKIAYHVDEESKVARLIFTSLIGKESFEVMSGSISEFISEQRYLESGAKIDVFGIVLKEFLTQDEFDALEEYLRYCQKKISKDAAKSIVKVRYSLGDVIALRSKIRDGSKKVIKKFIVRQIIWSINSNPVNVLILKQIEGPLNNMSLTKADCKKYHIKYEENLQVYSMLMNFTKVSK